MQKVVVRRLPPDMTKESFIKYTSPLPEYNYMYFVKADKTYGIHAYSRVYINFVHESDLLLFKEKFDNYIFLSNTGAEYPAVVEFAPFQVVPSPKSAQIKDPLSGSIESNWSYKKFVEDLRNPVEIKPAQEDTSWKIPKKQQTYTTPLLQYVAQRKLEKENTCKGNWARRNIFPNNYNSAMWFNTSSKRK